MRVLLIEPNDILRQAIGLACNELCSGSTIIAHATIDTAFTELAPAKFDLVVIEPSTSDPDQRTPAARAATIRKTLSAFGNTARIMVFTDQFCETEGTAFCGLGVDTYLAKQGTDLMRLRASITSRSADKILPPIMKTAREIYPPGLTRAEMIGYLVEQGVLSVSDLSEALGMDRESIMRYARRAKTALSKDK